MQTLPLSPADKTLAKRAAVALFPLGHPDRVEMLILLEETMASRGVDLAGSMGLSPQSVSQHVRALRAGGLLEAGHRAEPLALTPAGVAAVAAIRGDLGAAIRLTGAPS